jgi:hypothetical protein
MPSSSSAFHFRAMMIRQEGYFVTGDIDRGRAYGFLHLIKCDAISDGK